MAKRKMSTFERLESARLNRKQRRELERRVAAADPGLTVVHGNAGGIDVGNESHYVAVPPDRTGIGAEVRVLDGSPGRDGGMVKVVPDRHGGHAGHGCVLDRAV